ncbi:hypothetical protein CYMTET_27359 [Cymbomonas tetramitiformis]|uniref:Uncharacterized protein n=1 Tax=Cymbomonas tetramitiformis TaxID=36881 RepID=A0AAE0FQ04_9CHLO|nr:hypothetical protein CYMTET_27359 [Cymbomonas tetramitiformis]
MVEGQREVEVERMLRTRTRKLGGRGDHVVPKWLTKWKRLPNSHNQWRLEPLRIFEEEEEKREQGLRSTRHQKTNEKQASQGSQLAAIRPPTPTTKTQIQRQFKGFELVTVDILPNPPCTEYSKAKTMGESDIKTADRRVQRTREIIDFYDPAYYFIENPTLDATRGLHTRLVMRGLPEPHLTMYCRYGAPYMKPMHIWTKTPI